MPYEVRVTRSDPARGLAGGPITATEWAAVVARDATLRPDDPPAGDGSAQWIDHPSAELWFYWADGEVRCTHVDAATLGKLSEIADALGGIVLGDDGERYDADGNAHDPPAVDAPRPAPLDPVRNWLHERREALRGRLARKPFRVGERVRDVHGNEGLVEGYDYGILNFIRVRLEGGGLLRRAILFEAPEVAGLELASAPSEPAPETQRQSCSIYRRRGWLYIAPQLRTGHGFWIEGADHVARVEADAPEPEIGRAVLAALAQSRTDATLEPDPQALPGRLAEAAGLKSWATFVRSAELVLAGRETPLASEIRLEPMRKIRGASWEGVPERARTTSSDPVELARALKSAFENRD